MYQTIRIAAALVALIVSLGGISASAQNSQVQQSSTAVETVPPGAIAAPPPRANDPDAKQPISQQDAAQAQIDKQRQMFSVTGVPATYPNVLKAAIKLGAIDISSDAAIDDFAKVEFCDIYQRYHENEFDWRRVRAAIRKKIEIDKPNYPSVLYLERTESFGKYDFGTGMLPFRNDSIVNSRRLSLANSSTSLSFCGQVVNFPDLVVAELSEPLRLDGVELTEEEARTVISGLSVDPGGNRIAYGRYTLKLNDGHEGHGGQLTRFDATLLNVTLYEDPNYMEPFWTGQSSAKVYRQQEGIISGIPFKGIDPTQQEALDPEKKLPDIVMPANK